MFDKYVSLKQQQQVGWDRGVEVGGGGVGIGEERKNFACISLFV